jgi:hypothetical protein
MSGGSIGGQGGGPSETTDLWNYVRQLEARFSRMQDEYELRIGRMQDELINLKGQIAAQGGGGGGSYSSEMGGSRY